MNRFLAHTAIVLTSPIIVIGFLWRCVTTWVDIGGDILDKWLLEK